MPPLLRVRRSSHEERGLKCRDGDQSVRESSRSSHEERGLKYEWLQPYLDEDPRVAPRMRSVD